MFSTLFRNSGGELRNGWWIALFFLLLAAGVFPLIMLSSSLGFELAPWMQALLVLLVSLLCQRLRGKQQAQLLGALNRQWLRQLAAGVLLGAVLMALPALLLTLTGQLSWQWHGLGQTALLAALLLFVGVAVTEELTFRGFMFQRLIDGIGSWPAQLVMSAYFVLNHASALKQGDSWHYLAMLNIFIASLMFGLAYLRTRSLALPIGLHFMANFTQGTLFGFGVSGSAEQGMLSPVIAAGCPDWLSGGSFGLEASVPGLITVILFTVLLWRWRGSVAAA
jgi:membrane protease YdiL (CAAX protease family)